MLFRSVEHHDESATVVLLGRLRRRLQNGGHVHVAEGLGLSHDTLVAAALGNFVELLLRHLLNGYVAILRLALEEKLPSNNLPIMPYAVDICIDSVDLSNISKVALFTDGIVESETKNGVLYSTYLNEDFLQSPFLKSFLGNVYNHLDNFGDDTTVFFIRRPFTNIIKEKVYYFPTRYDKLDEASEIIRQEMTDCCIDADEHDSFFTAISECIMNAYEHGNLAITFDIKHELIKNGDYEIELLKKEKNKIGRAHV